MPRWISLLALVLCALLGGAAEVWAEGPAAVETHETAPPPASELPASEVEEEEAHRPAARPAARAAVVGDGDGAPRGGEPPMDAPTPPPPRR